MDVEAVGALVARLTDALEEGVRRSSGLRVSGWEGVASRGFEDAHARAHRQVTAALTATRRAAQLVARLRHQLDAALSASDDGAQCLAGTGVAGSAQATWSLSTGRGR